MSLRLEHVDLQRAGVAVLHDVSVEITPGKIHALLGANGAGKSSVLHVLAGDLPANSGQATLDGQGLAQLDPGSLARQRAVLAQSTLMEFDFPVADLVGLGRLPHALVETPADHDAAVAWALQQCELTPLAARPITQLSGGQQRRVHIARVLAQLYPLGTSEPKYLLLDEPTAGLDLRHALALLRSLGRLTDEGVGVLWISHDINLAARFADIATLMANGQVIAQAPPSNALTADNLEQCYGLCMQAIGAGDHQAWLPVETNN